MAKQRTEVADIDRSLYDFSYGEEAAEKLDAGLTPEIVREISAKKDEALLDARAPLEVARDLSREQNP